MAHRSSSRARIVTLLLLLLLLFLLVFNYRCSCDLVCLPLLIVVVATVVRLPRVAFVARLLAQLEADAPRRKHITVEPTVMVHIGSCDC
jgi:hypothetical protein